MKFPLSKNIAPSQGALQLEEDDLLSDLEGKTGSSLFLGKYTLKTVENVLKRRHFYKEAQKRGLWPLVLHLCPTETPPLQRFQVYYKSRDPHNLVVDLKIRLGTYLPKESGVHGLPSRGYRFLMLEWLTLQNPLNEFSSKRIPLPGQNHPGLGLGRKVLDMFIYLARVTRSDGILAYPAFFHNAFLFSRKLRFFNPEKRGEVLAVFQSCEGVSLKDISWIVHLGCLEEEGRGKFEWKSEEQIFPLNRTLKKWLSSTEYRECVKKVQQERKFFINWDCFEQKRPEMKDSS
ncbi:hypothetical protein ACFLT9_07790 [Acidobacteriota bacterium]